jgi:hypothetical protein
LAAEEPDLIAAIEAAVAADASNITLRSHLAHLSSTPAVTPRHCTTRPSYCSSPPTTPPL